MIRRHCFVWLLNQKPHVTHVLGIYPHKKAPPPQKKKKKKRNDKLAKGGEKQENKEMDQDLVHLQGGQSLVPYCIQLPFPDSRTHAPGNSRTASKNSPDLLWLPDQKPLIARFFVSAERNSITDFSQGRASRSLNRDIYEWGLLRDHLLGRWGVIAVLTNNQQERSGERSRQIHDWEVLRPTTLLDHRNTRDHQ